MTDSKDSKISPDFNLPLINQDNIKAEALAHASREPEPPVPGIELMLCRSKDNLQAPSIISWIINWIESNFDVRTNSVTKTVEYRIIGTNDPYQPVNENSFYVMMKLVQKVTIQDVKAVLGSEVIKVYDPFKNYFESLPTPTPGMIDKFCTYIETTNQEWFRIQFTKWLVRVIACALEPKSFNKQILTLSSPVQGSGKSTWLRYLCPSQLNNYYTESLFFEKDGMISLAQNFLINQDELAAFTIRDINAFKSFVSRDRVSVRHPYASKQTTDPRRASFMASTNETQFLTDLTGSVRWLIFEVITIKHKGISPDDHYQMIPIDQIWAEAYSLYKDKNYKREMTGSEISENENQNEKYHRTKPEYDYILKYCHPATENTEILTATEIRDDISKLTEGACGNLNIVYIGQALNKLNYKRICERKNEIPVYGYRVSMY